MKIHPSQVNLNSPANSEFMNTQAIIKRSFVIVLFVAITIVLFSSESIAQNRERVVKTKQKTRPTMQIPSSPDTKRKTLTNKIVVRKKETPQSLVRKTSKSSIRTINNKVATKKPISRYAYSATTQSMMLNSIKRKIGVRYRLGTQGPNRYDCSGFVWKVFQESGIPFTRTSARWFWKTFEPVSGNDRFEFGTLVFFNRLGHVGIVVDKNGFYHASSSRGVTYSKFKGYWSKRIVGYRRVPVKNQTWKSVIENKN